MATAFLRRRALRLGTGAGARIHSCSRSPSVRDLGVPGARPLLEMVARAPCLSCGQDAASGALEDTLARRVDCRVSGLPLTCSKECSELLESSRPELLTQYHSVVEDLAFAASPEARQLFTEVLQPSHRTPPASGAAHVETWMQYLQLYAPTDRWLTDEPALRLLSSAYSYVLTLSAFLPELLDLDGKSDERRELHVVGARAEAMMPRSVWEELSFFHPDQRLGVTLVGDHVPILPAKASASLSKDSDAIQLELVNALYHKLEPGRVRDPDAFVLFNPGVGHPRLRASWAPTMERVLASRKPALLTSFSEEDQQRDVHALQELVASSAELSHSRLEFVREPEVNPFRSLKLQLDPTKLDSLIQTNARVMVVQLV